MKKLAALTALAALTTAGLMAGFAIAQPPTPADQSERWAERLAELDIDGDGTLSLDETQAPLEERFTTGDTDGDGVLSSDELTALRTAEREERRANRQERRFNRLDVNEDGFIDADEFEAPSEARFERIDADGDGEITEEEARAAGEKRRGKRRGGRRGPGPDGAPDAG
ncbi:MAG: hypothetical protein AAF950_14055 [Pseudomonadota bacterium]